MHASTTERRANSRQKSSPSQEAVSIRLNGGDQAAPLVASVVDYSPAGICLETPVALKPGAIVSVTGVVVAGLSRKKLDAEPARVVYCNCHNETRYSIGLEFLHTADGSKKNPTAPEAAESDYYDVLQLSPKADPDTIHRVYRLLAQRYHPDNLETGDQNQFRAVLEAYRILSDPEERAAYDTTLMSRRQLRWKIFDQPAAAQRKEA